MSTVATLSDAPAGEYMSASECMRAHPSVTRSRLYRAVAIQTIRVRLIPGVPPRYHAGDVARLAATPGERGDRRVRRATNASA